MVATALEKGIREWVVFENEGQKVFGVLHRPPVENPPIVLVMHGFASSKIGTNRSWVYLAEALSKAGIATLRFDFRGAGDSEGELSELSFDSLVSDALKACEYVEGEGFSKIGFFGSSLGGAISILAAAKRGGIASLALWAPVASGELWYRDFIRRHPHLASVSPSEAFGSYEGAHLSPVFREQFKEMFAYKTLAQLERVPFLHFHAERDDIVSLSHQKAFEAAREGASAESRFVIWDETAHQLGHAACVREVLKNLVVWFAETL